MPDDGEERFPAVTNQTESQYVVSFIDDSLAELAPSTLCLYVICKHLAQIMDMDSAPLKHNRQTHTVIPGLKWSDDGHTQDLFKLGQCFTSTVDFTG